MNKFTVSGSPVLTFISFRWLIFIQTTEETVESWCKRDGEEEWRKVMEDKEEVVHRGIAASFLCIAVSAFLVRVAVSLHPYSGVGNPPKYGDFESQRHWMEITLNLPPKEWYRNSTTNDLSYWGLDYPPLTAYQSYVHGLLLRFFHPEAVSLFTSRGHESYLEVCIIWDSFPVTDFPFYILQFTFS
jgi:hypothetical protein